MVYDETPLYSPLRDEVLESFTSCNIFETKTSKDDYYEQEEGSYTLGCDTGEEDSLICYIDGGDDYWNVQRGECLFKKIWKSNLP